ncbi:S8 family serine peptidase [Chitinophaga flava]|uniref:Serine protease n=1 Tax=Chitinophaga flava TaxID=2259036 RepID=A0A365XVB0_9BACT|nr:S8 family serine peptidase [Chitinophaga flava]RBL90038.1 serine protease [Chitinophaga flava]
MIRSLAVYVTMFIISCLLVNCKKSETPISPPISITLNQSEFTLRKEQSMGIRLLAEIKNAQSGEPQEVTWTSENPRIASVKPDGTVWAEAAGETYIVATLVHNKGTARCKIIVTDVNDYKFRLILKDKGSSGYTLADPSAYLSTKAIERRKKRNIAIDATDLPISTAYLKAIEEAGGKIVSKSKWLNTVSIATSDVLLVDKFKALPFVQDVVIVWEGRRQTPSRQYTDAPQSVFNHSSQTSFDYGAASNNIHISNGQALHQAGFKGANIDIAVIDAGFVNLKANAAFSRVNIKGARSFIYEDDNPYATDDHGVWVSSCMAVNIPGKYVGSAPEANYWFLRTEDQSSEHPIEEDYWVAAAEFADSVGVDIINSSLTYATGYYRPADSYKQEDMDGKTAFATRGANLAARKGILIVNCAGNDRTWVGTPADSPDVLTIGSVESNKTLAQHTSWGVTADGRFKPDVMAMGAGAGVINAQGNAEDRSGTSYASPIICGLAACLWQAYPQLTNKEIIAVIRQSGDRADKPELPFGFGVADMKKAMELADALVHKKYP